MGKKTRKTRWRALAMPSGGHSDSEESTSNTSSATHHTNSYAQQKSYYSKYSYSSQSTPIRGRFQNGIKSTRSSSTTSENKITFNEDEYTKITTPRQDVLFKKGYLNKPKTYQTQTSTGNSTISTENSTGNGTPDHQSADGTEGTDLEYESQFVFPNAFVDHNGIYYINGYEPYAPLVVYNASPYCYPDQHASTRSKRYSTGSVTEPTSPHNEEASQDVSQNGSESVNVPEYNQVFNVVYPGFFYSNGISPSAPGTVNEHIISEPRKIKKRRRRKLSKPIPDGSTSEECESEEVTVDEVEDKAIQEAGRVTSPLPEELTEKELVGCQNSNTKTSLKPDAKEFVPRAYRLESNVQYVNIHPNFIHFPIINEIPAHFLPPPGIPINFASPPPINFVNFIPKTEVALQERVEDTPAATTTATTVTQQETFSTQDQQPQQVITHNHQHQIPSTTSTYKNHVDIETIVSKLQEAANEQNRKQHNQQYKFSPNKSKPKSRPTFKARNTDANYSNNYINSPKKQIPMRNYAETLQKSNQINRTIQMTSATNAREVIKTTPKTTPKRSPVVQTNQWISVSNRKKRKNRYQEFDNDVQKKIVSDTNHENPTSSTAQDDGFESYDVDLLVDVVPITPEENSKEIKLVSNGTDVCKISNTTPSSTEQMVQTEIVQNETITKINVESNVNLTDNVEETLLDVVPETNCDVTSEEIIVPLDDNAKIVPEDTVPPQENSLEIDYLIDTLTDNECKTKKNKSMSKNKRIMITDDLSDVKEAKTEKSKIVKKISAESGDKYIVAIKKKEDMPDKKKNNKKKKKLNVTPTKITSSNSSSVTTLNLLEDSYDFLIGTSSVLEDEKTNVEVSEEFDKIIQRGMYNSLEEKIKSLNITAANDGFFKTISLNFESRVPKQNDIMGFSTLKPKKTPIGAVDFTKVTLPDLEMQSIISSTSTSSINGSFLDITSIQKDPGINNKYPITQAVKDWMIKTRETTPEVEILKSPSVILKEFEEGEEVTVFSSPDWSLTPENSFEEDPYWEDEIAIDVAEDTLEIYESKYGKNEDFQRIKLEVEEKKRELPKHANLPYRAICCSLM